LEIVESIKIVDDQEKIYYAQNVSHIRSRIEAGDVYVLEGRKDRD